MGAAASVAEIESGFSTAFQKADVDNSGTLEKSEFLAAARTVTGLQGPGVDLDGVFDELDESGVGTVRIDDFVRVCVREANLKRSQSPSRSLSTLKALNFADWLSPSEAQHGFATAHQILAKNPSAAKQPLKMPGKSPGSPWLPLHYLLARLPQASGSNPGDGAALARLAAEPLVLRLLELHPSGAAQRVQEGVRWQLGHLPLEFGITRGWSAAVVAALVKAFPAGATALEPVRKKKKFDPKDWKPESPRGCRWMRKIATDVYAARGGGDHDYAKEQQKLVLRMLPRPNKTAPLAWTAGLKVEEEEKEKARKKAEKEAKKQAAKERKERLKAEKVAKRAAKAAALAEKQRLKDEAGKSMMKKRGGGEPDGDEFKLELGYLFDEDATTAAESTVADAITVGDTTAADSTTVASTTAGPATAAKPAAPLAPVAEKTIGPQSAVSAGRAARGPLSNKSKP